MDASTARVLCSGVAVVRTAEELAKVNDPGWPTLLSVFRASGEAVRVLPVAPEQSAQVLYGLQVTARSALGAMALNCGGVLVDNGWLRLLGGGYHRLPDPAALNGLGEPTGVSSPPPSLKVAYDVLGGQFAVDGGGLGTAPGPLCYFGPDTLNWVGLGTGFGAFVAWACSGHLDSFYRDLRWPGWEQEVGAVGLDQGLIDHRKLAVFQGLAQLVLEGKPRLGRLLHVRFEEADGVTPIGFRVIHGGVGVLEKILDLAGIAGEQGDAHAGR